MQMQEKTWTFLGQNTPPLANAPDSGEWRRAVTAANGAPTVAASNGAMTITLDSTAEVQNACLYLGDQLPFDIDQIKQVDFFAKLNTANLSANVSAAFGLCSARNDTIDSLAAHASFRAIGSNTVVVETDDGVNDLDDKATGQTLGTDYKRFTINLATGIQAMVPPPSAGGKACVLFDIDNADGHLRPVARATRFNMENYSGGLQIYAQLQKDANAATAVLSIKEIRIRYQG